MVKKTLAHKYALLSVFNKEGIVELAKILVQLGYSIISTGGTAKTLQDNDISVIPIQEVTGNPESFDGRMKTISFQIESGILFDRNNPEHLKQAAELNIKPIDIVVCNLYPFEQKQHIENIDVGGPTMIRAAAKNHEHVLVLVDPKDYTTAIESLSQDKVNSETRKKLAAKAFGHVSFYDSQIAAYFSNTLFPQEVTLPGRKVMDLRYGENPHQQAAVYIHPHTNSVFSSIKQLWGRGLSLTNVSDINAGVESVRLFEEPCAVIIKHNSPCGIALGESISQALERAIQADPESAFGGVIVLNKTFDRACAQIIASFKDERKANIDILAAPQLENVALEQVKNVRKSMGIYELGQIPKVHAPNFQLKWIDGGFMLQNLDEIDFSQWKVVTKKQPTDMQMEHMKIAWKFISRIRSNAIIIVDKDIPMTRGIGSGQTSRYRSTQLALNQADTYAKNGILASDSFFPFDDSVKLAAKHGISAIVQQGGSIQDELSIKAADELGVAMIFTSKRAFWH